MEIHLELYELSSTRFPRGDFWRRIFANIHQAEKGGCRPMVCPTGGNLLDQITTSFFWSILVRWFEKSILYGQFRGISASSSCFKPRFHENRYFHVSQRASKLYMWFIDISFEPMTYLQNTRWFNGCFCIGTSSTLKLLSSSTCLVSFVFSLVYKSSFKTLERMLGAWTTFNFIKQGHREAWTENGVFAFKFYLFVYKTNQCS